MTLRPAQASDLGAVLALVDAAYRPWINRIGREPGPMGDDYAALIAAGRVHLAVEDDVVQGLVVLIPQPDAMLLDNVAVAPLAQGTGIGRRLMAFAELATTDAGHDRIRLYTHQSMTENIALYRRYGYAEIRRAVDNGFPRVFMEKVVRSAGGIPPAPGDRPAA